ncbi:MAG: EamA family transporter [Cyclobacteriaceae bacterium]|jgi:drug/metabolite transporter (DMT)-like permease|nr:EamA family transporter [Cyclobacteriaceae bacterium]
MKKDTTVAYIALAGICLIWGTTYLALRIAVLHFPPFLFTIIRQVIAGGLMLSFMTLVMRAPWPDRKLVINHAIGGFFMISIGNGLVAWAEMEIPSGIAAILCSLMPVVVILINLGIHREERPSPMILLGVLFGMAGIVIIFSDNLAAFSRPEYWMGIALILIAVLGWAGGSLWIKRKHSDSNPFINAGIQMFFGGIWLIPFSLLFDDLQSVSWSSEAFYAMIYLVVFGSIIAYASYLYALRKLPMTIVSMYAYVNPVVAVLLGWLILNENFNPVIGTGILTTVLGIFLVNQGYRQGARKRISVVRN